MFHVVQWICMRCQIMTRFYGPSHFANYWHDRRVIDVCESRTYWGSGEVLPVGHTWSSFGFNLAAWPTGIRRRWFQPMCFMWNAHWVLLVCLLWYHGKDLEVVSQNVVTILYTLNTQAVSWEPTTRFMFQCWMFNITLYSALFILPEILYRAIEADMMCIYIYACVYCV